MTEQEWLAAEDPFPLLLFMYKGAGGLQWLSCHCCLTDCRRHGGPCPAYRKVRLFAWACCLRLPRLDPDPVRRAALRYLEDFLEGRVGEDPDNLHANKIKDKYLRDPQQPGYDAWMALYGAVHRRWRRWYDNAQPEDRWAFAAAVARNAAAAVGAGEARVQICLFRDIFGNALRPLPALPPSVLAWNDETVRRLAKVV